MPDKNDKNEKKELTELSNELMGLEGITLEELEARLELAIGNFTTTLPCDCPQLRTCGVFCFS